MVPSAYFRKEGQSNYTLKASSGWNETTHFGIVFTFHYVFLRHGKVHSISKESPRDQSNKWYIKSAFMIPPKWGLKKSAYVSAFLP